MGRKRTVNTDLPPRMLRRIRGNGAEYYYYVVQGAKRKEIPLGPLLGLALKQYEIIVTAEKMQETAKDQVPLHVELFKRMSKSATIRKIESTITESDIERLLLRAKNRCELSGIAFDNRKIDGVRIRPWAASIDRIDPSGPYSVDNCRVVCSAVNIALNQFGDDILFLISYAVVKNRRFLDSKLLRNSSTFAELSCDDKLG